MDGEHVGSGSLLQQADADARARAMEIAGERLGDLMQARAGVFQIRGPHSTETQCYARRG